MASECWQALGYAAHAGAFELRHGMVVHRVELSIFPNWTGIVLPRRVAWDGDQLILTTPPAVVDGISQYSRLTWERVAAEGTYPTRC